MTVACAMRMPRRGAAEFESVPPSAMRMAHATGVRP
jgi:hypothetical protein